MLVLNSIPIENEEEVIYCLENLPEPITLESGIPNNQQNNYTYYWEPSQEISESIETNDIVTHKVTVTNKISGCSKTKTINIIASNKAKFDVDIDGISNTNTVTIHLKEESLGDYVYSVDNQFSTYQEENIFQNLKPGTHIIYVKDLLGCGISSKEFDVLVYLASRPGTVVSKEELHSAVWKTPGGSEGRTIDVHISTLRKKLGEKPDDQKRYLHTSIGAGVKLESPDD